MYSLISLQNELLNNDWFWKNANSKAFNPLSSLNEDSNKYTIKMELPGLSEKDLDISFQNNTLIIKGEKRVDYDHTENNVHYVTRQYGSFNKQIPLNVALVDMDNINASLNQGVLTVTIPKKERQERILKISVKSD